MSLRAFDAAQLPTTPTQLMLLHAMRRLPRTLQLSIGSEGSFLSIGSRGSVLSIGSIGSACSIGSIGSACDRLDRLGVFDRLDRLGMFDRLDRELLLRLFGTFRRIAPLGPVQLVAAFDDVAPVPKPAPRRPMPRAPARQTAIFHGPSARLASNARERMKQ
jgi:hypothetical protein